MKSSKLLAWYASNFLKGLTNKIVFTIFSFITAEVIVLLFFIFIRPIVDTAVYSKDPTILFRWGIIYGLMIILGFGFSINNDILTIRLRLHLERKLREYFYNHSLEIPANIIFTKESGYLLQRVLNDVDVSMSVIGQDTFTAIGKIVSSIPLIWFLFSLNPKLALIAVISYPLHLINIWILGPKLRPWAQKVQENFARLSAKIQESLQAITTIRILNLKKNEQKNFNSQLSFYLNARWRYFCRNLFITSSIPSLLQLPLFGLLIWLGANEVLHNRFTIGGYVSFFFLFLNLMTPISAIAQINGILQPTVSAIDRLYEFYNYKPPTVKRKYIPMPKKIECISFDAINFSYDTRRAVLKNFHLIIPNSQIVAIIGQSGVGKTTLISLLLGLLMPSAGTIRINDVNLTDIDLEEWRKALGLIEQDTFIFNRSIYENIQIARLETSREEIETAAAKAGLHEFILSLPQGYQTIVGERGFAISGGERQRIAIARIFLKSPSVIIMDEPTSALDISTEQRIMKELKALSKNRTVLLTTHRPSLLKMADIIYKLESGKIVNHDFNGKEPAKRNLKKGSKWNSCSC
jgi:ABC-type bacteriocin/lantibiotic exporter with double-glycine peptidase domain